MDDAIVVIENIARYLEAGHSPHGGGAEGLAEIGFTVLSMSISLVAVFIPILLMGGIVGRLFREFAVTLSMAIAVSLFVSLTTTPMMCARFLRPVQRRSNTAGSIALSETSFNRGHWAYGRGCAGFSAISRFMLAVTIATVCLSVYLYIIVPKGFFPQQDTGGSTGRSSAHRIRRSTR